jgi:hypothetical protein
MRKVEWPIIRNRDPAMPPRSLPLTTPLCAASPPAIPRKAASYGAASHGLSPWLTLTLHFYDFLPYFFCRRTQPGYDQIVSLRSDRDRGAAARSLLGSVSERLHIALRRGRGGEQKIHSII